ncbi:hypothetical protein MM213_17365 [Belliella sp. R4-6]|uniref:Uncharacterized protein n=1 Tax=Belliella alkalica TaxID=1730871 RepID=A0ABS9VFT0_9BACT|nr:hypothetical protein [Belliella alkalica]MCH7415273.1 hypothetical protein [Belliella alkalica]
MEKTDKEVLQTKVSLSEVFGFYQTQMSDRLVHCLKNMESRLTEMERKIVCVLIFAGFATLLAVSVFEQNRSGEAIPARKEGRVQTLAVPPQGNLPSPVVDSLQLKIYSQPKTKQSWKNKK